MRAYKKIAVLCLLLAAGLATGSYAMPERKKKKKETTAHSRKEEKRRIRRERRQQKHERKAHREEDNYTAPKKTVKAPAAFRYPPTVTKDHYRIDIFAAMYLDELVQSRNVTFKENKIPERALPGVSFYEGVAIAADSLKRAGYNIEIYVHDATSAAESPDAMMRSGGLDSADLVIGVLQPDLLGPLADFAKKKKINFVSAGSGDDGGITGNKYFTMLHPGLKTHCNHIMDDIGRRFPGMQVSMLYRSFNDPDNIAFRYFADDEGIVFRQLQCNSLPSREDLAHLFDTTHANVVVIPVMDAGYADSLLHRLSRSFPAVHFEVYGMPTWTSLPGLRREDAYPNLSINITTAFYADPTSPAAKQVTRVYKETFGGKATDYVMQGYEVTLWYASLLRAYGTVFNTSYPDISGAPFTRYRVKPRWNEDGHVLYNENRNTYMSRYEGGAVKTE